MIGEREKSKKETLEASPFSFIWSGPLEFLDPDVAEPDVVAVVLQADVAFVVLAAAVDQQVVGFGPFFLAELALVEHLFPLRGPQVILEYLLAVLVVYDGSVVHHDLGRVPLSERLGVLRLGRNHIVQRGTFQGMCYASYSYLYIYKQDGQRRKRFV